MKRKLAVIILAILLSGVAIAVYAMDVRTDSTVASCCACCKDSCPMKTGDTVKTDGEAAKCDCCKDGDSCPMGSAMAGNGKHAEMMKQMQSDPEHAATMKKMSEGGEACPMMTGMKDDAKHAEMMKEMQNNPDHAAMMKKMSADGKGPGCACCKHKAAKKDAPAN